MQIAEIQNDHRLIPIEPVETRSPSSALDQQAPVGLRTIRATNVWEMGITGAGVLVGTFDSGVNSAHPCLAGHWRGSLGYPSAQCWLDLVGTTTVPTDAMGHGTQTMSILCGLVTGDTIGVAWGATYIAARLNLSSGATTVSSALTAFEWAVDPDGNPETFDDVPRILSCSWGLETGIFQPCYNVLNTAIDNIEAAGTAVFWAAGNEGTQGNETIRIPADRATTEVNTFAVGGYDYRTDSVWAGSSRGPSLCGANSQLNIKPEVVAPSYAVRCAINSTYNYATGTSYAAPHAAGVAALMLEIDPALTPDSLKKCLLYTASDKGAPGNDNDCGYGLIDAFCAVMAAAGGVGWVSGVVTDAYDYPVVASIAVEDHPQKTGCTEDGAFLLSMPAQMPLTLIISAPTFDTVRQEIMLVAGDTLDLEIALTLAYNRGVLSGTVINCESQPAAGAMIILSDTSLVPFYSDSEGHFREIVPANVYDIITNDGDCAIDTMTGIEVIGRGVTDIEIILHDNPAHQCSGPNAAGYRACDDRDPGGPVYQWNEIAPAQGGSGVVYNLSEDVSLLLAAPFPIRFCGINYQRFYLNSNGNLSFGRSFTEYTNTALPRGVAAAIYPFWDDLSDNYGGDICTHYEPSLGTLTIEWYNVPRYDGEGNETFQLAIYDPVVYPTTTGDAMFEFRYGNLSVLDESTVGIEGPSGSSYLQYAYNGAYPAHACSLQNGRAIRFTSGALVAGNPQLAIVNPLISLTTSMGSIVDTAIILSNAGTLPVAYSMEVSEQVTGSYSWSSSRQSGGPAFEYSSIAGVGINTGIARDDTTTDPVTLPWLFPYYGRYFNRMTICSNGYVSFNSGSFDRSWSCNPLSDQHDPYSMLGPYWVDLDITAGGSVLHYFDSTRDRFIVQWNLIRRYQESGTNTFQVILYHDGTIEFVYSALSTPLNNGTVGIKGRNTAEYLQLAYRQNFLQSNTLIRICKSDTSSVSCTMLDAQQGIIPPAGSVRVPLRLVNQSLTFSQVEWEIKATSSDPAASVLTAQVEMGALPPIDSLRLVILADTLGVRLHWNRIAAPMYCIYSGFSPDEPLDHFEIAVTDTFAVLPYTAQERIFFEVRLCDQTPPNR